MYLRLMVNVSGVISTENADRNYEPTLVNMESVFIITEGKDRVGSKLVFNNGRTLHCRESLHSIQAQLNGTLETGYVAAEPQEP